jgi:hypothetical protein
MIPNWIRWAVLIIAIIGFTGAFFAERLPAVAAQRTLDATAASSVSVVVDPSSGRLVRTEAIAQILNGCQLYLITYSRPGKELGGGGGYDQSVMVTQCPDGKVSVDGGK